MDSLIRLHILLVDDKPTNLAVLEDLLDDAGYEAVHSIGDPRQVMPYLASHSVDLVLLDIRMPYLSGLDLLQQMQAYFSHEPQAMPPVMVLTAESDELTREQALRLGARDFLGKPFLHWEVLLRVENLLRVRQYYRSTRARAAELEHALSRRERELQQAQLEIVRRLAQAAEFRDNETGMHVERMSRMAQLLARLAGCDDDFCAMLLHASSLHDLGKIGIPDAILLKPGRLEDDEMRIMREHARIGQRILSNHPSALMEMASVIAVTHHEKWDGGGYPEGLAGEAIPLSGRICALVDVFDALCSERPYKKAWSESDAAALIAREAGRHFDPALVALFLQHLPEFQAIRLANPDLIAAGELQYI